MIDLCLADTYLKGPLSKKYFIFKIIIFKLFIGMLQE